LRRSPISGAAITRNIAKAIDHLLHDSGDLNSDRIGPGHSGDCGLPGVIPAIIPVLAPYALLAGVAFLIADLLSPQEKFARKAAIAGLVTAGALLTLTIAPQFPRVVETWSECRPHLEIGRLGSVTYLPHRALGGLPQASLTRNE